MSLLLAACGGGDAGQPGAASPAASGAASPAATSAASPAASGAATTTTAGTEQATSSPASGTATTAAAGGEQGATGNGPKLNKDLSGTVNFWHFWGSPVRRNAIRRVIAICNQQLPNIKVNETFKPFGDIWTANIAAVAAGSGMPDVIVEDRPQIPQRARDQVDESLQELAARDGIDGSTFWPFTWQQTLYENQTYGIPYETDVRVLFWNKNAFKEVGLDPEKPPTTWAEVEQYADKLDKKNEDGTYARIGFHPLIKAGTETFGYTNGVEWINSEDPKPQVNTPEAVETVEWVKKWVDRYGGWQNFQKFRGGFAAPPQDEFMSGKVAMITDINGYTSQLDFYRPRVPAADGKMENLDWGVSYIPYNKERGSTSGGFALSIPRGAPNKDAAWEFIKCATGPEAQASWARDTYAMPANQAAAKDPVLLADPRWQFFVEAMNHTSGGTYLAQYPNWKEQLEQRYEKVWTGELDAKTALDEAQQAIEAQMKQ
jgi:multiple sugar transport system substrate-binding protein